MANGLRCATAGRSTPSTSGTIAAATRSAARPTNWLWPAGGWADDEPTVNAMIGDNVGDRDDAEVLADQIENAK